MSVGLESKKRLGKKKKPDSSVMAKIINEALVGLGAAAGAGSAALAASSCRTKTKPHSSPKQQHLGQLDTVDKQISPLDMKPTQPPNTQSLSLPAHPFPLDIRKAAGCWRGTGTSALIVRIQLISQTLSH